MAPPTPPPPPDKDPAARADDGGTPEKTPGHSRTPGRHAPESRHAGHGRDAHPPALRRTVVRPAGATPDPVDAAFVAGRLTTLTHELSTLLDGSLRVIGLARRSIAPADDRAAARREVCPEQLSRQLDTVDAAMRQMAELVRSSMTGMSEQGAAGIRQGFGSSSSLADAVRHAVDVMAPMAEEHAVVIDAQISPDLAEITAGPIYAVIVNGARNAIESIQRVEGREGGGAVVVRAWTEAGKTGRCVRITIDDDGAGLPGSGGRAGPASDEHVFDLGYTTKRGGSGIGLSLSRDVLEQLGGTIELHGKVKDPRTGRSGAVLEVCYPVPDMRTIE